MSPEPLSFLNHPLKDQPVTPGDFLFSVREGRLKGHFVEGQENFVDLVSQACGLKARCLTAFFSKLPGFEPAAWTAFSPDGVDAAFFGLDPKKAKLVTTAWVNAQKVIYLDRYKGHKPGSPDFGRVSLFGLRISWVWSGRIMMANYASSSALGETGFKLRELGLSASYEEFLKLRKRKTDNFYSASLSLKALGGYNLNPPDEYPGIVTPAMADLAGEQKVLLLRRNSHPNDDLEPAKVILEEDHLTKMLAIKLPEEMGVSFQIPSWV